MARSERHQAGATEPESLPSGVDLRCLIPAILVCAAIGWGMWYCFPQYDDALVEILKSRHESSEFLLNMHQDRPAWGWLFEKFDQQGLLWKGTAAANLIGWALLAWLAARLAGIFFPGRPEIAIAAALLTVAPILVEMQFMILNNMIDLIGLGALAMLLVLHPWRTQFASGVALVAAFVLVLLGAVVSEYLTALGIAGAVLLTLVAHWWAEGGYRGQLRIGSMALASGAVFGYLMLSRLKSPDFRPGAGTNFLFADGWFRFVKMPFRIATALYQASVGAFLRETGSVVVESYETIAAAIAGLVLATASVLIARSLLNRSAAPAVANRAAVFAVCAVTITIGLLPFLLMGRRPNDVDFNSRFFDPVLPIAGVLSAGVLLSFLPRGMVLWGLAAIAFVAGYATISKPLGIHEDDATLAAWGEAVRQQLAAEGTTVAIVPLGPPPRFPRYGDDALTSIMSRHWSPEERLRFWARTEPGDLQPDASSRLRGAELPSPVAKVLLIRPDASGAAVVTEMKLQ